MTLTHFNKKNKNTATWRCLKKKQKENLYYNLIQQASICTYKKIKK